MKAESEKNSDAAYFRPEPNSGIEMVDRSQDRSLRIFGLFPKEGFRNQVSGALSRISKLRSAFVHYKETDDTDILQIKMRWCSDHGTARGSRSHRDDGAKAVNNIAI